MMATSMPGSLGAMATANGNGHSHVKTGLWALVIGSIGVVYGDIGTSPLYAFREATLAASGHLGPPSEAAVFGVLSLIFWSLILVVTLKYVVILIRADNNGEGGTLALMALAQRALGGLSSTVLLLGIAAAALFYGNAVITPALSVLSAVEGLEIVAPKLETYITPISIVVLLGLFLVQSHGTARMGAFFGPIMVFWFAALAFFGVVHIWLYP